LKIYMKNEIQIAPRTYLNTQTRKRIMVCGFDIDEDLIKDLLIVSDPLTPSFP